MRCCAPLKFLIVGILSSVIPAVKCEHEYPEAPPQSHKLLILLLDGFRWDYYDKYRDQLPGFRRFLDEGVRTAWVEPIFPSLSVPSWMTIATGLYPDHHNILGNYMLQLEDETFPEAIFRFKDNSSHHEFWWDSAEPLWITATKQGHHVYLADFARCDVPFKGHLPHDCYGFHSQPNTTLYTKLERTLTRFDEGYSLAMVYDGDVDSQGHAWGPDSPQVRDKILDIDTHLLKLLTVLEERGLSDQVNIAITSDHGMASIINATAVHMEDWVNPAHIYKVIDCGSVMKIVTHRGKLRTTFEQLRAMPGVDVYSRKDIPEEWHFKKSRYAHDILLVARQNHYVIGLEDPEKQVPHDCGKQGWLDDDVRGLHGYSGLADMRAIFFLKGPAFKKGMEHAAIRLEDEYQVFAHVLGLVPGEHNGTWARVKDVFV